MGLLCCLLSASSAFVAAFTLPSQQGSSSSSSLLSSHRSRPSATTKTTRLFLSDEIREYRKGLSQINSKRLDGGSGGSAATPPGSGNSGIGGSNISNNKKPLDCVFKFGGSSLADAERIDHVARLIRDQIAEGFRPRAVVCSAMGKTTNNLLSAGEFALGE